MDETVVCHESDETDLYRALLSCTESGLRITAEGNLLTAETLRTSELLRESPEWEGECLLGSGGELAEIRFFRRKATL